MDIHLFAIEKTNFSFLACFFGICHDPAPKELRPKVHAILEAKDKSSRNCVHYDIHREIPFASFLAVVCSTKVLIDKDCGDYTPMHIAMGKKKGPKESIPERPVSARNAVNAPGWDDTFYPPRILEEILRKDDRATSSRLS
jgi:hypothetical protein